MDEQDKTLARVEGRVIRAAAAIVRQTLESDFILERLVKEDQVYLADNWLGLKSAVYDFWEVARHGNVTQA